MAEYTSDIRHIAGAANVVADTLSRPPGLAAAEGPPLAATCVKVPSRSQVVTLQGGKLNSSSPSPGVAAGVGEVQPAMGISFQKMTANQASCLSTLQAAKVFLPDSKDCPGRGSQPAVRCGTWHHQATGTSGEQAGRFPTPSTVWHTLAYVLPSEWYLHVLCGRV
jgi:hypothetical protein